jgi:hypothetical protein
MAPEFSRISREDDALKQESTCNSCSPKISAYRGDPRTRNVTELSPDARELSHGVLRQHGRRNYRLPAQHG